MVNLGAGLETMNRRLHYPATQFYSVDFPDVIKLRKEILGEAENETQIGCDMTDLRWTEAMDVKKPVIFIVSGVFQYFYPEAVTKFLAELKAVFQNAEMVFDATNEAGIHYAQCCVKKSGNRDAKMHFYVNDAKEFSERNGVTLLEARGFYREAQEILGKKLGFYTRMAMKIADGEKSTLLLHIRLA